MTAAKLTLHQKRTLVALCALTDRGVGVRHWRGVKPGEGYFTRWEIMRAGRMAGASSVQQQTAHALWRAGLAEPESELVVELVRSGVCRCGCDRWRATEAGRTLVAGWNVKWVGETTGREA